MKRGLVCAALLAANAVAADPTSEADKLADEAKAIWKDKCSTAECRGAFKPVAEKLRRAYALNPDARYAKLFCAMSKGFRKHQVDLKEETQRELLVMCDVAALGGDQESAGEAKSIRFERKGNERVQKSATLAARALYGHGLALHEASEGNETLSYDAATTEVMQEVIRDHYMGLIKTSDDLMSTAGKLEVCLEISRTIRDSHERDKVQRGCWMDAAREANAVRLTFIDMKRRDLERGPVFTLDAKLRYVPTVVVGSKTRRLDTARSLTEQRGILEKLISRGSDFPHYKEVLAMKAEADKAAKGHEAKAKSIRKAIDAKPSQIAFMPYPALDLDVPKPITGHADSCATLYALSPNQKVENVELVVKVDGTVCSERYALDAPVGQECKQALALDGKHRVEVELYHAIWKKTGTKKVTVHRSSIDIRDEEESRKGKKLAAGKITCGK